MHKFNKSEVSFLEYMGYQSGTEGEFHKGNIEIFKSYGDIIVNTPWAHQYRASSLYPLLGALDMEQHYAAL